MFITPYFLALANAIKFNKSDDIAICRFRQEYENNKSFIKKLICKCSFKDAKDNGPNDFQDHLIEIKYLNDTKHNHHDRNENMTMRQVLINSFWISSAFLDHNVNDQTLRDEIDCLWYLCKQTSNVSYYNLIQELTTTLKRYIHSILDKSKDKDIEIQKNMLDNLLCVARKNIVIFAETLRFFRSIRLTNISHTNVFLDESNDYELSNMFFDKEINSSQIQLFKRLKVATELNNCVCLIQKNMESHLIKLYKTHSASISLKKLLYYYFIYSKILSSVNSIVKIVIHMVENGVFNFNATKNISDKIRLKALNKLFRFIRQCNVNILLSLVNVNDLRVYHEEDIDINIFVYVFDGGCTV